MTLVSQLCNVHYCDSMVYTGNARFTLQDRFYSFSMALTVPKYLVLLFRTTCKVTVNLIPFLSMRITEVHPKQPCRICTVYFKRKMHISLGMYFYVLTKMYVASQELFTLNLKKGSLCISNYIGTVLEDMLTH